MVAPLSAATSLSRHAEIHAKLQLEIMDVKEEVARLKNELRRDQDPGKMSRIQSQIGVSVLRVRDAGLCWAPCSASAWVLNRSLIPRSSWSKSM